MTDFILESGNRITVAVNELIVAAWAGRDDDAIQEHIEELQALGVTPPSATPLFYRVSADRLTTDEDVQVLGEATSGEVEVFLLGTDRGTMLGVVSDHTDRDAEAWSVAHSKQVCPKPVASRLWRLVDALDHWDDLRLASWATIGGRCHAYQEGTLAGLLPPGDLLQRLGRSDGGLAPGQAMLCGTLPVNGGVRPAERFDMALIDPVLERRIEHGYRIQTLPIVA